jgi:hypothetical protein
MDLHVLTTFFQQYMDATRAQCVAEYADRLHFNVYGEHLVQNIENFTGHMDLETTLKIVEGHYCYRFLTCVYRSLKDKLGDETCLTEIDPEKYLDEYFENDLNYRDHLSPLELEEFNKHQEKIKGIPFDLTN